ncbi:MAG: hypothetical protein QME25_09635 [Bacteroidota bacterium]|nr:hypothetical protein [Bacteroidota bacterium]
MFEFVSNAREIASEANNPHIQPIRESRNISFVQAIPPFVVFRIIVPISCFLPDGMTDANNIVCYLQIL